MHRRTGQLWILLMLVTSAFLWQNRAWFPPYQRWQQRQQIGQDLEVAVQQERPDEVRRLLDEGADIRTREEGDLVIFEANSPDVVGVFLSRGFDVNTNDRGDTLIAEASCQGNLALVKFLLHRESDLSTQGADALKSAEKGENYAVQWAYEMVSSPRPDSSVSEERMMDLPVAEAEARQPYEAVIAFLEKSGVRR